MGIINCCTNWDIEDTSPENNKVNNNLNINKNIRI